MAKDKDDRPGDIPPDNRPGDSGRVGFRRLHPRCKGCPFADVVPKDPEHPAVCVGQTNPDHCRQRRRGEAARAREAARSQGPPVDPVIAAGRAAMRAVSHPTVPLSEALRVQQTINRCPHRSAVEGSGCSGQTALCGPGGTWPGRRVSRCECKACVEGGGPPGVDPSEAADL